MTPGVTDGVGTNLGKDVLPDPGPSDRNSLDRPTLSGTTPYPASGPFEITEEPHRVVSNTTPKHPSGTSVRPTTPRHVGICLGPSSHLTLTAMVCPVDVILGSPRRNSGSAMTRSPLGPSRMNSTSPPGSATTSTYRNTDLKVLYGVGRTTTTATKASTASSSAVRVATTTSTAGPSTSRTGVSTSTSDPYLGRLSGSRRLGDRGRKWPGDWGAGKEWEFRHSRDLR